MIPVPTFSPGVSIRSIGTGGSKVTDPQSDPPEPLPNGGFNFSNWTPQGVGSRVYTYQDVLNWQAEYNSTLPLKVSPQGNLIVGNFIF